LRLELDPTTISYAVNYNEKNFKIIIQIKEMRSRLEFTEKPATEILHSWCSQSSNIQSLDAGFSRALKGLDHRVIMYLIEAKAAGRHHYFCHLSSRPLTDVLLVVCMAAAASELRGYLNIFFYFC
jgi:hypothetical protein